MIKNIIYITMLFGGTAFLVAACSQVEGVDYLRLGHPAEPTAKVGKHETMSRALMPENITATPKLEAAMSTSTTGGSMKKAEPEKVDHSQHGGGN